MKRFTKLPNPEDLHLGFRKTLNLSGKMHASPSLSPHCFLFPSSFPLSLIHSLLQHTVPIMPNLWALASQNHCSLVQHSWPHRMAADMRTHRPPVAESRMYKGGERGRVQMLWLQRHPKVLHAPSHPLGVTQRLRLLR